MEAAVTYTAQLKIVRFSQGRGSFELQSHIKAMGPGLLSC